MKRKVSIILSLILLVSTTGFTIDKHYCNDKLVNIFLMPHFGKCCDSSMPVQDEACDDLQVEFLSDVPLEFIGAKIDLNTSIQESLLPETFLLRLSGSEVSILKASVKTLPFSPVKKPKIYLQVESFLN